MAYTLNFTTADLIDIAPNTPSCEIQFFSYGKHKCFYGKIRTVRCFQDNGLVKKILNTPSDGEILVVDGSGSLFSALIGDQIAESARKNGWKGVIVFGVIRDTVAINQMEFGIKSLGSNPRKSTKDATGEVDIPVIFGNIKFIPGEYIFSDEDGILASPDNLISLL